VSNPDGSRWTPPDLGAPLPPRHGCLTGLMVLVGIVLLLPGLCALLFGVGSISNGHFEPGLMPFVVAGLVVGAIGVLLIWAAIRGLGR
jgi:hypothetical protein